MEALPCHKRRIRPGFPAAVKRVAKLYLLGLLLSLLAALLGLMDFLGELVPLPGPEPFLPGQPMQLEGGPLVDSPPGALAGEAKLQTHEDLGSYS